MNKSLNVFNTRRSLLNKHNTEADDMLRIKLDESTNNHVGKAKHFPPANKE